MYAIVFFGEGYLRNLHLPAIPLMTKYTGEEMVYCIIKVQQSTIGSIWMDKLFGLSTDGTASIVSLFMVL